jgi:hypothetical protein
MYDIVTWCSGYRQVLDWWPDLLDSFIQRVNTLEFTVTRTRTHTSVYSHVFTAVAWYRLPKVDIPYLWVSELTPAWATSFSQQQLTKNELRQFSNSLTNSPANSSLQQVRVKVMCTTDGQSFSLSWCRAPIWSLGLDILLLLSDSCGFLDVGSPLWREDGSVVYNFCWSESRGTIFPVSANRPCLYHLGTDCIENAAYIIPVLSSCRGNIVVWGAST